MNFIQVWDVFGHELNVNVSIVYIKHVIFKKKYIVYIFKYKVCIYWLVKIMTKGS